MLRYTAKDGRQGKNNDPSQHQPAPANDVAQPADTDYQGRDYEQIRTYNPLDFLESGVERLASVGKPTLAMLVPREDNSIDSERLTSTHRTDSGDRTSLDCVFIRLPQSQV